MLGLIPGAVWHVHDPYLLCIFQNEIVLSIHRVEEVGVILIEEIALLILDIYLVLLLPNFLLLLLFHLLDVVLYLFNYRLATPSHGVVGFGGRVSRFVLLLFAFVSLDNTVHKLFVRKSVHI